MLWQIVTSKDCMSSIGAGNKFVTFCTKKVILNCVFLKGFLSIFILSYKVNHFYDQYFKRKARIQLVKSDDSVIHQHPRIDKSKKNHLFKLGIRLKKLFLVKGLPSEACPDGSPTLTTDKEGRLTLRLKNSSTTESRKKVDKITWKKNIFNKKSEGGYEGKEKIKTPLNGFIGTTYTEETESYSQGIVFSIIKSHSLFYPRYRQSGYDK